MSKITQNYAKLLSDVKWMTPFNKYVDHIRDETVRVKQFPRYEDYSYLARKLPFFLYDNEDFKKALGVQTAFTTGDAIYMDLDFFIKCLEIDEMCKQRGNEHLANTVLFILMHEIAHCLNDDMKRMPSVNHNIANIATDIANNLPIMFDLGIEIDVKLFAEHLGFSGYGMTKEEYLKFRGQSSETIALWMYKEGLEQLKQQQNKQNQSSQSQNGQQSDSSQAGQSSNPLDSLAQEAANALTNGNTTQDNDVNNHVVDHNSVAEAAKAANINPESLDRAGLRPRTAEETSAIEKMNEQRARQSALEMEATYKQLSDEEKKLTSAGTQGDYYKKKVNLGNEGKIDWKVAVSESFESGGSMETQYTEEVLVDEYFTNAAMYDGVHYTTNKSKGTGIYIVDTSGSMKQHFLDNLFSEGLASVDLMNDDGFESLLIFPADTNIKDVYWELTLENKDEVIEEVMNYGGGGTDFTLPIKDALLTAYELDFDVKAVVFGTDLEAYPPNFDIITEAMPESKEVPPIVFITDNTNESFRNNFEEGCNGYAQVFFYEDGLELDIAEIQDEIDNMKEDIQPSLSM